MIQLFRHDGIHSANHIHAAHQLHGIIAVLIAALLLLPTLSFALTANAATEPPAEAASDTHSVFTAAGQTTPTPVPPAARRGGERAGRR